MSKILIEKTNLNFRPGQKLTVQELNEMNNKINELVDFINNNISELRDNFYSLGTLESYSQDEAIKKIPEDRRSLGLTLKYLDKYNKKIMSYTYLGKTCETENWTNLDNWQLDNENFDVLDGGAWE